MLAYIFFFLLYLLDMTLFDRKPQLSRSDHGLSQLGSKEVADGFAEAQAHGYASHAV